MCVVKAYSTLVAANLYKHTTESGEKKPQSMMYQRVSCGRHYCGPSVEIYHVKYTNNAVGVNSILPVPQDTKDFAFIKRIVANWSCCTGIRLSLIHI